MLHFKQLCTVDSIGSKHRIDRNLVVAGLYGLLNFVLVQGAALLHEEDSISLWHLPAGLLLAGLMIGGLRFAPVIIITGIAVNLALQAPLWLPDNPLGLVLTLIASPAAYFLVVAALLLFTRFDSRLRKASDVVWLIIAMLAAPAIAAPVHSLNTAVSGFMVPDGFWSVAFAFWVGDLVGIATVAPILLAAADRIRPVDWPGSWRWPRFKSVTTGIRPSDAIEIFGVAAAATGLVTMVYIGRLEHRDEAVVLLVFLPLVWTALRYGWHATAVLIGVINPSIILTASLGPAPADVTVLQLTLLSHCIVAVVLGVFVTERRMIQRSLEAQVEQRTAELQESEARYRSLIDMMPHGIEEIDHDGVIRYANPAYHRMLGYADGELAGRHILAIAPESDRAKLGADLRRILIERPSPNTYYAQVIARDGRLLEVERSWTYKTDQNGGLVGLVSFITDITQRRQAEAQLQRFRAIVEASPAAIAIGDMGGQVFYANPAHERLFGYPLDEAPRLNQSDYYTPQSVEILATEVAQALERGESWEGVLEARSATGRQFPLWQHADVLRGPDGMPILTIGVFHDYSEERRRERELRETRDAAERASAAKTRFLAAASHDLRQPLQAGIIFLDLLANRNRDPALTELINRTAQSLNALQDLLNSLLDISKLDAGIIEPDPRDFAIAPLLELMAGEFTPLARARSLNFRMVTTQAVVHSDPHLLERILRNLVANAVRYTESGRILLGCRRAGSRLRVQVLDTGIGIPDEQLRSIFEEFYQLGNQARDRRQGLGLGLAIVDRLAKLLGHEIGVRSAPGRGTMFEVIMPLGQPAAGRPAGALALPDEDLPLSAGMIAVIDDDPHILQAFQLSFEAMGFDVVIADSAEQALNRLERQAQPPDAILADYRLQDGKTGNEAIHRLRQYYGRTIPGILITGDTSPDRLKEAKESGFYLLHKPVRPDELRQVLDLVLGHRAPIP